MTDQFANEPIPTDGLPLLADEEFVSIDPRYLRVALLGFALTAIVVGVVTLVVAAQGERPVVALAVGGVVLVVVLLAAALRTLEVRRLGYQLRAHDISLRSGVITHSVESLPFSRVQHVNINQGPVERALGLATLEISSAGPDLAIPGLAADDAARIKTLVTERAATVDTAP